VTPIVALLTPVQCCGTSCFHELRVSKVAIAEAMKISRNQLYLILGERQPVTPDTAVILAAAVGGSPRL
jgi:plasmid maintenance system antidote protein VapI